MADNETDLGWLEDARQYMRTDLNDDQLVDWAVGVLRRMVRNYRTEISEPTIRASIAAATGRPVRRLIMVRRSDLTADLPPWATAGAMSYALQGSLGLQGWEAILANLDGEGGEALSSDKTRRWMRQMVTSSKDGVCGLHNFDSESIGRMEGVMDNCIETVGLVFMGFITCVQIGDRDSAGKLAFFLSLLPQMTPLGEKKGQPGTWIVLVNRDPVADQRFPGGVRPEWLEYPEAADGQAATVAAPPAGPNRPGQAGNDPADRGPTAADEPDDSFDDDSDDIDWSADGEDEDDYDDGAYLDNWGAQGDSAGRTDDDTNRADDGRQGRPPDGTDPPADS